MYKTTNTPNNPLNITQRSIPENGRITQSDTQGTYHNTTRENLICHRTPLLKTQKEYGTKLPFQ